MELPIAPQEAPFPKIDYDTPWSAEKKLAAYGRGPWTDEPDRVEWRKHGLPCLIRRAPMGNYCGYVGVPEGHPFYGMDAGVAPFNMHGGCTIAHGCDERGACHVPEPGEAHEVWWIGFDCGHGNTDVIPSLVHDMPSFYSLDDGDGPRFWPKPEYRTTAYVAQQVEQLADQIHQLAQAVDNPIAAALLRKLLDPPSDSLALVPEAWRDQFIEAREIPGRGLCVLQRFMTTVGLLTHVRLDSVLYDYDERYCYPLDRDARRALAEWNGEGDPPHDWVKEKNSGRPGPGAPDDVREIWELHAQHKAASR